MNYRRILIAAVFILYIQWKKTVKNVTSWRHKTLSASAIRKQVSRCWIHFPHELTCQILTNQSIKIKRRAWPTRDNGEKSQKRLPSLDEFSRPRSVWNPNFNGAAHEHNLFHMHFKKIEREPAIIWKVAADNFKKVIELSGSIPERAIRSGDNGQRIHCFDSCQLITTWMVTWMYNNRLQAPKLARKCEIKHWYACGTDGQAVGVGHVIAKFSGMDRACDQIKYCWKTKKKYLTSMGRKINPWYSKVITASGCSSLTAFNWPSLEWRIFEQNGLSTVSVSKTFQSGL